MESNVINVLSGQSLKWELRWNGRPKDENRFNTFTQFILQNENWVAENSGQVRAFCIIVEEMLPRTNEEKKVYETLLKKFPLLFPPRITVQINEEVRQISKNRLEKCSEVFSLMVNGGFSEAYTNVINLNGFENIELKEITCFLDYLENGKVNLNGVKAAPLLRLAQLHGMKDLFRVCLKDRFIAFINNDKWFELLNVLKELYFLDLHVVFYKLFDTVVLRDKLSSFLDVLACEKKELSNSKEINASQKEIFIDSFTEYLKLFQKCFKLNIEITFKYPPLDDEDGPCLIRSPYDRLFNTLLTDSIYREVDLSQIALNEEILAVLVELNKKIPINELRIQNDIYKDDDLEKLALCLPNLESLTIHNQFITRIPDTWLQKLQKLNCRDCYRLIELEAPLIKHLISYGCIRLKTITASNAIDLECSQCVSLLDVKAFKAEEFNHFACNKLKLLIVKKGCKIDNVLQRELPADCKIEYVD